MAAPTTLAGWLATGPAQGLPLSNYVPQSLYPDALAAVQRNIKSATNPPSPGQYAQGEACLIARGLLYWKSTPGDCGSPTVVDLTSADIASGAGQIAGGIASMAGATIPGLGAAVQAVEQIFAHHAQAVATEQQTICSVAQLMNQIIPYYDLQVRNGNISPGSAIAGMQNFIAQVNAKLQTIYKPCNAACVYMSFLAAHSDFLNTYYPAIAPAGVFAHRPGAPPITASPTAPGGVIQSGGVADYGNVAAVSPMATSTTEIVIIAVIVGIIIFALMAG